MYITGVKENYLARLHQFPVSSGDFDLFKTEAQTLGILDIPYLSTKADKEFYQRTLVNMRRGIGINGWSGGAVYERLMAAYVFGANLNGDYGRGEDQIILTPKYIPWADGVTDIAFALDYTLLIIDGGLYQYAPKTSSVVTQIRPDLTGWTSIVVLSGANYGICNGRLYAWGNGHEHNLGTGNTSHQSSPVEIGGDATWNSVTFRMAIRNGGELWGWGLNANGYLGDGTTTTYTVPTKIGDKNDWVMVKRVDYVSVPHMIDANGDFYAVSESTKLIVSRSAIPNWTDFQVAGGGVAGGKLYGWGGSGGQVGNGAISSVTNPVLINDTETWANVARGSFSVIASTVDGKLFSWGNGGFAGQFGVNATEWDGSNRWVPTLIPSASGVSKVFSVPNASDCPCAYIVNGTGGEPNKLYVFGHNRWDSFNTGFPYRFNIPTKQPESVPVIKKLSVTMTRDSKEHPMNSFIISTDGSLYSAGSAGWGTLGIDAHLARSEYKMVGTAGGWTAVSCGWDHVLGIRDGALYSWGRNNKNQLGLGPSVSVHTSIRIPELVDAGPGWTHCSGGEGISAGIKNGRIYTWGNDGTALGLGASPTNVNVPTLLDLHNDWTDIVCGHYNMYALRDGGKLYAWGSAGYGALGDGTTVSKNTPVQIGVDGGWTKISSGGGYNWSNRRTFGIKNGALYGWGKGAGLSGEVNAPIQIGSDTDWTDVSVGNAHTLGIRNGSVYAFGDNVYGQLGDGTYTNRNAPGVLVSASIPETVVGVVATNAGSFILVEV